MSNLREKARAVKAAGEAERGNFEPTGAPKRMYDYWLRNTKSSRGRAVRRGSRKENFCHFWRVVAIWGPLMWLSKTLSNNSDRIFAAVGIAAAIAFVVALLTVADFWMLVLGVLAATTAFGVFVGGFIAGISFSLTPEDRHHADLMTSTKTIAVFAVLGFPGFVLGFLSAQALGLIDRLVKGPIRRHPKAAGLITAGTVLALSLYVSFLIGGFAGIGLLSLILVGSAAVVALGVLASVVMSDYVSGKRSLAEQQRELYYETHGEYPVPASREPNAFERKLDALFRGLGDFIILIAQVVRVNKWKICPTVEIDTSR